jgi:hypothetical protein
MIKSGDQSFKEKKIKDGIERIERMKKSYKELICIFLFFGQN